VGTLGGITTTIPSFPTSGGVTPFTQVHGGSVSVGSGVPLSSTLNTGLSLATFVGFFLDLLLALFVLSIIGVFVIIVVANRADPDPTGRRPQAVYYFAVSFVTLAVTVVASAVVVSGIDALVGNHSNAVTNAAARAILVGVLAVLMAGVLLTIHLRRGLDLVRQDTQAPAPSKRVGQSYVASVAFVSGGSRRLRIPGKSGKLGPRPRGGGLSVDRGLGGTGDPPPAGVSRTRHPRASAQRRQSHHSYESAGLTQLSLRPFGPRDRIG
jgi:uncharacterized membrane protein